MSYQVNILVNRNGPYKHVILCSCGYVGAAESYARKDENLANDCIRAHYLDDHDRDDKFNVTLMK